MGLGKLLTRNLTYDVTDTQTGGTSSYTLVTDGGPGMYAGWGDGPYRGGMGIPAAWRLALLIANQLGRVPWDCYRKMADRPAVQLPDQALLTMPAGTTDTKLSVFRSWGLDRLWHGNAIGIIAARSPLGYPTAATPVSAENVQVRRFGSQSPFPGQEWIPPGFTEGEIGYLIGNTWFHQSELIHYKGPCKPGQLRGMGVLEAHFDLMSRSRKLGAAASSVDASAVPTGLLRSLNPDMSPEEAQELKDGWRQSQRERTVAVLNPLTEFTPIAWNPTETQLLESREFDIVDWANVFGVSSSYAGGTNPSRVYANIEDQGLDLLKYGTPGDIIAEFEAVLSMLMPRGQYVKANLDHLLRADTKTRYEAHAIGITAGFVTRDEVRALEERPPLTPEQKADQAAMVATAPPGNNTPGSGAARPRLAAVRALVEQFLADDVVAELEARKIDYTKQPRWPAGSGEKSGEWTDGPGGGAGAGGGARPIGGSSALGALLGGSRRPATQPAAPAVTVPAALAVKPKTFTAVNATADRLGVDPPSPSVSRHWSAQQWGVYWATAKAGSPREDAETAASGAKTSTRAELPEVEPEFEPGYDDAGDDPARDWLPGEAQAWAADDAAGGAGEVSGRARAGQEALHRYWTAGPGLAKWRGSPTPWRTLRGFLSKYLSGETLDATTSAWYRDVFGHLPQITKGGRGPKRRRT